MSDPYMDVQVNCKHDMKLIHKFCAINIFYFKYKVVTLSASSGRQGYRWKGDKRYVKLAE